MNNTSILILGARELGMAVLRNLAKRVTLDSGNTLTVLLRPATIASNNPSKQRDIAELQALGIKFLPGDLAANSISETIDNTLIEFQLTLTTG